MNIPLDPNIAMGYKPPQIADPQETLQRAMSLKQMAMQGQMGQIQLQNAQLENQQRKLEIDDDQKMRQAWMDASGDPEKMFEHAMRLGVGPNTMMKTRQALTQQAEARAKLTQAQMDALNATNDQLNALLQPVLAEKDPVKQEALWNQQSALGVQRGVMTPEQAAAHPYPGSPDAVKAYAATLATDKWVQAQAAKTRADAAAQNSQINMEKDQEAKTKALLSQLAASVTPAIYSSIAAKVPRGVVIPDVKDVFDANGRPVQDKMNSIRMMTMTGAEQDAAIRQRNTADRNRNEFDWIDQAKNDPDPQRRKEAQTVLDAKGAGGVELPPAPAFGAPGERNEAWLGELQKQDPAFASQVAAVVDGRYPVPTGRALTDPKIQKLLQAAANYEPGFDLTQWGTRSKLRGDAATGKIAQNTRSLNTAIHHAGALMDSITELNNDSYDWVNAGKNWAKSHFKKEGNKALARWGMDYQALMNEATSLFRGTSATNEEVAALRQWFKPNAPMEEQRSAAREIIKLCFGRIQAVKEQFDNAFRKPGSYQFVSPDSMRILSEKLGMNPEELGAVAQTPNVDRPASPAPAAGATVDPQTKAAIKAAVPFGSRVRPANGGYEYSTDGKTWQPVKLQAPTQASGGTQYSYTEADVRARAKAQNKDPEAAVKAARDAKLIP